MKKAFSQENFISWLNEIGYFEEGHLTYNSGSGSDNGLSREEFISKNQCWESSFEWAMESRSTAQFLESLTQTITKSNIISLEESKM